MYILRRNNFFYLIVFTFILVNCASGVEDFDPKDFQSGIKVTEGKHIRATALGASPLDSKKSEAELKRGAKLRAELNSFEMLSEALQGVQVEGEYSLRDVNLDEGLLSQKVETSMTGVRLVGEPKYQKQEDGSWLAVVTMEIGDIAISDFRTNVMGDGTIRRGLLANQEDIGWKIEFTGTGVFGLDLISNSAINKYSPFFSSYSSWITLLTFIDFSSIVNFCESCTILRLFNSVLDENVNPLSLAAFSTAFLNASSLSITLPFFLESEYPLEVIKTKFSFGNSVILCTRV